MGRSLRMALGIVLIAVFMGTAAFAAGMKVGVIDTQKILQKSKAARDARGAFLLEVEAKRATLKSREAEVRKMDGALKTFSGDRGSAEFKGMQEKMAQEVKDLKRLRADLEEELKKKDREMSRELLLRIREVVEEYRQKEKLTLILERKMTVAFDEAVDVTDQIIERFDARTK